MNSISGGTKMKKLLILLAMLTVIIAGCGKNSSTSSDSSDSSKKVTINFTHWRGEDTKAFDSIIEQFEKKNPNIHVEMTVFPSDSYQSQIQGSLLSGEGIDVFASFPGSQFETIRKANGFAKLDDQNLLSKFDEKLIQAGKADNTQYALPYQLVYNIPVYNKGIFEKLNLDVPKDWNSFLKTSETLKKNGYTPILFSGDVSPSQFINPMIMNNEPTNNALHEVETGKRKLTDEWFIKTLSQIKELNDKGYFQKDALGTKKESAAALFAQEKGAMLAQGSYMMATVKQQNPKIDQGLLAPITVNQDKAKYEGVHTTTFLLGVAEKSKHKEAAKKFLTFLADPKISSEYANATGQLLTVKDVKYDSPELKESAKWKDKKTVFQPRFTILNERVSKAVETSVQDVLSGMSAKKAAEKAQGEVERVAKN